MTFTVLPVKNVNRCAGSFILHLKDAIQKPGNGLKRSRFFADCGNAEGRSGGLEFLGHPVENSLILLMMNHIATVGKHMQIDLIQHF